MVVSCENPIPTHPEVVAETTKSIMSPLTVHSVDQPLALPEGVNDPVHSAYNKTARHFKKHVKVLTSKWLPFLLVQTILYILFKLVNLSAESAYQSLCGWLRAVRVHRMLQEESMLQLFCCTCTCTCMSWVCVNSAHLLLFIVFTIVYMYMCSLFIESQTSLLCHVARTHSQNEDRWLSL